jgi:hypothetical protein
MAMHIRRYTKGSIWEHKGWHGGLFGYNTCISGALEFDFDFFHKELVSFEKNEKLYIQNGSSESRWTVIEAEQLSSVSRRAAVQSFPSGFKEVENSRPSMAREKSWIPFPGRSQTSALNC